MMIPIFLLDNSVITVVKNNACANEKTVPVLSPMTAFTPSSRNQLQDDLRFCDNTFCDRLH